MAKEMTRVQLERACRRTDRENDAKDRQEVERLVKAMTRPKFKFYAWELEEVKRLVHGAYGRLMIHNTQ